MHVFLFDQWWNASMAKFFDSSSQTFPRSIMIIMIRPGCWSQSFCFEEFFSFIKYQIIKILNCERWRGQKSPIFFVCLFWFYISLKCKNVGKATSKRSEFEITCFLRLKWLQVLRPFNSVSIPSSYNTKMN